ncbi:hypothetical protein [Ferrovibrio sp.]|uniref:hypothetical protein n=1 Tax=Ferrovibrio sp. TaxID=1917215 RepID=UPI00262A854D|nr:hypothetical protein [Ferrovibrio sp.]
MRTTTYARFFRSLQTATETAYIVGDAPAQCIIGGKMFRVADSTLLANYTQPYETYGDAWLDEDLYRSVNGRLFLRLVGGPESIHRIGGAGGGQLLPLDTADAKRWLEFRGLIAEYVAIFGEPEAA